MGLYSGGLIIGRIFASEIWEAYFWEGLFLEGLLSEFYGMCATYCANPKTVNTRIISGMFLCCEEKANQMQDEKNHKL